MIGVTTSAVGVVLAPDDIVVTAFSGELFQVDPVTGAQTTITTGGNTFGFGITVSSTGDIFATLGPSIIRVDPLTGFQTTVSTGGLLVGTNDIAIAANGDLLVADRAAFGGFGGVIRVNPLTGAQSEVSSGGFFREPFGLDIAANGEIFVGDPDAFGGVGGVIRVDPSTGFQTVLSSGGNFFDPRGVAIAANGDLFVADAAGVVGQGGGPGRIIKVNPVDGTQTVVASAGLLVDPFYLAIATNGDLFVADPNGFTGQGRVLRISPGGSPSILSSGGQFGDPLGIAIVPILGTQVAIDIKPGSFPNSINLKSKGVIPVAILSTNSFDASSVDPSTVAFGPGGAGIAHIAGHINDVNDDGILDLVLHFRTQETGIACGDTTATLIGETFDGQTVEGEDSVRTVGCQ